MINLKLSIVYYKICKYFNIMNIKINTLNNQNGDLAHSYAGQDGLVQINPNKTKGNKLGKISLYLFLVILVILVVMFFIKSNLLIPALVIFPPTQLIVLAFAVFGIVLDRKKALSIIMTIISILTLALVLYVLIFSISTL